MIYNLYDTIVAVSTPRGVGGIGIIRLSGVKSLDIICKISKKEKITNGVNHASFYCKNDLLLDKGVILFFKSPKSFTGEDVVELHAHGNDLILDALVCRCIEFGARMADHGEFSFRSYINGKIDLIQAEAVNSIIKSQSLYTNKFIFKSLLGSFSEEIKNILNQLLKLRIDLESTIEFPDHFDFNFDAFYSEFFNIYNLYVNLFNTVLLDSFLNESLNVVILGNVNVGKSSLFNCLLNRNRSIVSDIPGTTRDFIDCDLIINGCRFKLIDTAGFNSSTKDCLEKISIDRTLNQAKYANILVFVVDGLDNIDFFDDKNFRHVLDTCIGKFKVILLRNKIDLLGLNKKILYYDDYVEIFVSVKNNEGIDLLVNEFISTFSFLKDNLYFVGKRQYDLLLDIKTYFDNLLISNNCYQSLDLYAENVNLICKKLHELIGIDISDDILNKIFSQFCVGK